MLALQMGKLRYREPMKLAQGHSASKSQHLNAESGSTGQHTMLSL